jgi:dihydroorotate dehydrogenase
LVKLSPDLEEDTQEQLAQLLLSPEFHNQVDGIILTNTSTSRPSWLSSPLKDEIGGLSGRPIRDLSTAAIRNMYARTKGQIPIVGVGGIASGRDAYEKLKAGASLVQVYTGMVYQGPGLASKIRHELAGHMLDNGQRHIQDVIGVDHPDLFWVKRQRRLAHHQDERKEETIVLVEDKVEREERLAQQEEEEEDRKEETIIVKDEIERAEWLDQQEEEKEETIIEEDAGEKE